MGRFKLARLAATGVPKTQKRLSVKLMSVPSGVEITPMRSAVLWLTLSLAIGMIGVATGKPLNAIEMDELGGRVEKDELVLDAEVDPDFGYIFHVKDEPMLHLPISGKLQGKKRELAKPDTKMIVMIYNHTLQEGGRFNRPMGGRLGQPVGGRIESFTKDGKFTSNIKLVAPGGAAHGPPPVSYDGHFVSITVEMSDNGQNGRGRQINSSTFKGILVYPKPAEDRRLSVAYLDGNAFYSAEPNQPSGQANFRTISVHRGELAPFRSDLGIVRRYTLSESEFESGDRSWRWRVAYGCLWYTGSPADPRLSCFRIPYDELALIEQSNVRGPDALRRMKSAGGNESVGMMFATHNRWQLSPLLALLREAEPKGGIDVHDAPPAGIYFDFLPVATDRILLFVWEPSRLRIWRGRGKELVSHRRWQSEWEDAQPETIAITEPPEPFVGFGDEKLYYVVTQSGSVYAFNDAKNGTRKAQTVWSRGYPPFLTTVVVDVAARRYHAFRTTGREAAFQGDYFEFAKPDAIRKLELTAEEKAAWIPSSPVARSEAALRCLVKEKLVSVGSAGLK
jgi:hypothetical protein